MEEPVVDLHHINHNLYTIHIVDDSPLVITALTNVLEPKDYIVTSSTNGKDAIDHIIKNKPDLVVLDVEMPVMDGYETIEHLKNNKKTTNIPVIFLTGLTKPEIIKHIFDIGASDYISKPFVPEEILARIEKEIQSIMLQNMLKEKMSKLVELLSLDSNTKTYNKMYMTSIIKTKLQKCKEQKKGSFSLMYMDIDNFNTFIKSNGINFLDVTLKKIAMIIKRSISDKDILSHWDGDKFMILFHKITKDDLDITAKNIRDNIAKAPFMSNTFLTCSISMLVVSDDDNVNKIINRLETAMQDAKKIQNGSIIKMVDL